MPLTTSSTSPDQRANENHHTAVIFTLQFISLSARCLSIFLKRFILQDSVCRDLTSPHVSASLRHIRPLTGK